MGSRLRPARGLLAAIAMGCILASGAIAASPAAATAPDPSVALEAVQVARIERMAAAARHLAAPARLLFEGQATLVLPARAKPYTVAELQTIFPSSWVREGAGVWLLTNHLPSVWRL